MSLKIFSDFDGTITTTENMVMIIDKFVDKKHQWMKDDILSQRISIQEGISNMFQTIPSIRKEEVKEHVLFHTSFREGFHSFVDYTRQHGTPLYVISGGLDFFVQPLLHQIIESNHIYCNQVTTTQDFLNIHFPYPCDDPCNNNCGLCKTRIIRSIVDQEDTICVIGDSITDLQMAKMGHIVFARDLLAEKCTELNIPFYHYESFYDIQEKLQQLEVIHT